MIHFQIGLLSDVPKGLELAKNPDGVVILSNYRQRSKKRTF